MQRPMSAEAQGSNIDVEVKGFFPNQQEEEILNRQLDGTLVENAPSSVLAYASRADIAAMVISGIAAIIAGALNPLLTVSLILITSAQRY
jgi:ATP-binding cassette subfamily B (MDR/TAP) protein 1